MDALLSHSQPAQADDLLPCSPPDLASRRQLPPLQRLVHRMTRVWLRVDEPAALRALAAALDERRYSWRRLHPRIFAVECGGDVRLRAWVLPLGGAGEARSVVEFRRSRGCGLAFKRRFLELRAALDSLAASAPLHAAVLEAPLHALAPSAEPMDT